MITTIREKMLTSNAVKGFIYFVFGSMVLSSLIPIFFGKNGGIPSIARVNGYGVSYLDFKRKEREIQQIREYYQAQFGQYADMIFQMEGFGGDPAVIARQAVIKEEVLRQDVEGADIHIHPAYIADNFPLKGADQSQIRRYLSQMGLTMAEFERALEQDLRRVAYLDIVGGAAHVPLFELKSAYMNEYVDKNFSVLKLSHNDYVKKEKGTEISSDELKSFFEQQSRHENKYWIPEKRSGMAWEFGGSAYGITVSDEDIADYYDTHKVTLYTDKPAQVQVRTIVFAVPDQSQEMSVQGQAETVRTELLQSPADFAKKAESISADADSAKNGGLMDAFARGVHEPIFEKAAFLLKNDGDISSVIRTARGFEIVQRVKKEARTYKSLSSVKDEIEKKIMKKKFAKSFLNQVEPLLEGSTIDEQAIQEFIANKKAKEVTYAAIERGDSKIAQELFGLNKDENFTVFIDGETGIILKLTAIEKRHLPELDAVTSAVADDLRESRASKALKADLESYVKNGFSGSFDKKTGMIKKGDAEKIAELKKEGMPVEQFFSIERQGALQEYYTENDGYLVRLDEIGPFDDDDFSARTEELNKRFMHTQKEKVKEGFIASLYRNATIEINETDINS